MASDGDPLGQQITDLMTRTAYWNDDIARAMIADIGYVLPYDMLEKVDRASMWNSLEVRSPFLDSRLLALAFAIPGRSHVGLFGTKRVLRALATDLLPGRTVRRRKRGFGIPLGDWLRGDMKWLLDRLSGAEVSAVGLLDPLRVDKVVGAHLSGRHDRSWELWNLIVLQTWATRFPWSA